MTIRERENPRCQNTFLPKRYRGVMTEFLPLDGGGVSAEPSWPQLRPVTAQPAAVWEVSARIGHRQGM
ncbi:MAG: hypothetical protein ACLS3F_09545 [Oscillospiraceae bacterium]